MRYKCHKCGYLRQPTDLAPDNACPRCGVAYADFEPRTGTKPSAPIDSSQGPAVDPDASSAVGLDTTDADQGREEASAGGSSRFSKSERVWLLSSATLAAILIIGVILFPHLNVALEGSKRQSQTEPFFGVSFDATWSELKERGYECRRKADLQYSVSDQCSIDVRNGRQLYDHNAMSVTVSFDPKSGLVRNVSVVLQPKGARGLVAVKNAIDQFHRRKAHIDDMADEERTVLHWERSDGSLLRLAYHFETTARRSAGIYLFVFAKD